MKPVQPLEPAVVDPRKLRRTAWALVVVMLVGGFAIYFAYLKAAEREANDDRPSVVGRFKIGQDMDLTWQDGSKGHMSELYGGVWLVCGISAKQPETWAATREVLKRMSEKYAGREDFHILCLSVDPANEGPEVLKALADEVGAKQSQWRFADGNQDEVHKFLKNGLRLETIPELKDGKWGFDPSITVVDKDLHMRKGTVKISKHRRQSFPFNFEEAVKLDQNLPPDDSQRNQTKLEALLVQVIDYTLAQPITK